ncbi:MAG: bifunctional metallophosphatase/5'-nucleotidase [Alistipes sp.]|nr:bifunctional metallophosphatase/5'-nucleotidase [Alistipes sp.]
MRKILFFSLISLFLVVACGKTTESIYIIATNDIHATIDAMPELATLVKSYEDKGEVLVVDSGDRVSGNAYVDDATESGMPIIELMNVVGYDLVTIGNHEFDKGTEALSVMINGSKFEWLCANATSEIEGLSFVESRVIEVAGVKLGFVGIVATDNNGYPLGKLSSYEGITFSDDLTTAITACEEISTNCDFVVLLSHMGLERDRQLADKTTTCSWIAGGHSHDRLSEKHNASHISQNNKNIRYATVAKLNVADGEILSVEYEQIDMSTIEEDAATRELVDKIKLSDPTLNEVVARANGDATHDGVANLTVKALESYPYPDGFIPEVIFYHFGGVRLSEIKAGDIRRVDILNNDPFQSTIYIGEMTADQMAQFILDKYNSGTPENPDKESHYPYFRSNIPYQIVRGSEPEGRPDATGVELRIEPNHKYRVAMCNYIAESYIDKEIVNNQLHDTEISVREALLRHMENLQESGYTPDNTLYQTEL